MPTPTRAIVIFGNVVTSSSHPAPPGLWLRGLAEELDAAYGDRRLAPFRIDQGDTLQGVLAAEADPLDAVLRAALSADSRSIQWVVTAAAVDAGRGPSTPWTGGPLLAAREAPDRARSTRAALIVESGDRDADALLAGIAPALTALLGDLTVRQREIARLLIVVGLRQSDAAARLGISRPTISVAVARAHLREIARLATAIRALFARGLTASDDRDGAS